MKIYTFLFIFLIVSGALFAQSRQYQFQRIDMESGLSHQSVNDILSDSSGFIWFATLSGLNRYDGYSMKVYRNIPGDSTSLLVDDVTRLYEGPEGNIWIYTHNGNNVYDPITEKFNRNTDALLRKYGIAIGLILFVHKDSKGNYWFIHYNQGLFYYNPNTKQTVNLKPDPSDSKAIASSQMSEIVEDSKGNIWILHQNGTFEMLGSDLKVTYRNAELTKRFKGDLFDYRLMVDSDGDLWISNDRNFGCFYFSVKDHKLFNYNNGSSPRLNSNIVRKIVQHNDGMIWIATDHGGINLLDKKTLQVEYLMNDEEDQRSISENSIPSLVKDKDGIIWLGTYKSGVCYYHENIFRFQLFQHQQSKAGSLPFQDINAFAEDEKGNLWIGTNGGGLIYFNRSQNTFKQYLNNPNDKNSISNNVIVSLLVDHQKVLWIGTYFGGLNRFDGKKFTRFVHDPANPKSLGDDNVWEIIEDSNYNLWLGTLKGGVDVYDRNKNEFYHYKSGEPNSVHTNYIPGLREDNEGNMWMGTGYGLEVLEKRSGRFVHYLNDLRNPKSISSNGVLTILQDTRGLIWIGTYGGLNLFHPETRTFTAFQEKDGLSHNFILTLVEDDQRNIWMSTPKGLSKLTVSEDGQGSYVYMFNNYDKSDGLISGAFHENAVLKCASGELVFGGSNGFNIFQPKMIGVDTTSPNVIFTDFQIFNKSVKIGEEVNGEEILPEAIARVKEITLGPENNVFSIEFAALNYFHPEKSHYKYMMEGFNKEWLTTDATQRRITFTNLDPGDYVFKVKASNSEGFWSDKETVLRIKVLPPFWKSNIAIVLYAFFILSGLLFIRWLTVTRERMNFRVQHERLEAHRMHELDMMKIKFFTNVSHEFRTPLTLILTPLEKILKNTADGEQKKQFQLIHRNARRLLSLVNQLLDFRKVEVQEVKFTPSEGDMVSFIRDLVDSFSDLSEKKNVSLSFETSFPSLETLFDQDKIEKILFNLLSNAFKFTPEHGSVSVTLGLRHSDDKQFVELKVTDTGIGIPKDKQQKIFERFFQNDLPESLVNQGSGIGLSITHEFVKVHGGTIELDSEVGKGSSFTVLLPVTVINQPEVNGSQTLKQIAQDEIPLLQEPEITGTAGKPLLLLVEDNEDFRFYLKDNLKIHYSIIEAANGKQALQKALTSMPDLIVSDVMMPEMNGVEFCKKVKGNPQTSHIPVILLTARSSEEQKLEGFETGASDYITKPFNFEILQSRIKNLILERKKFQKSFQKHLDVKASEIKITSLDEKMIQNTIKVVEDHLADPDFSVEELSREMGMSRVHLYKKLLALTGKSPIEFIRTIRLQRAAQLLEKSQFTVSEIAFQVGFNNPKYFARYFKEQYQMLPSVYAAEKKGKGL